MTDPKPDLSSAAIQANIDYYHSQLDQLETQRDLLKESLDYWINQKTSVNSTDSN
jgi:hypothetical protein